jgi:nitroimidazol reductase NimA-like FMN-containing flavoprotein (pyridoxamine 5'-phosphate oxidase superfamily)
MGQQAQPTDERLAPLRAMAKDVIDENRYMVLGTAESDGRPRVSPVYYTHDRYRTLYWVSSPAAQHSQNLADRNDVAIVIFDSSVAPRQTQAVYLQAFAAEVPESDLTEQCAIAFRGVGGGARAFTPDELSGAAPLRLYRASVTEVAVHIRGSDPDFGQGVDTRMSLSLPLE